MWRICMCNVLLFWPCIGRVGAPSCISCNSFTALLGANQAHTWYLRHVIHIPCRLHSRRPVPLHHQKAACLSVIIVLTISAVLLPLLKLAKQFYQNSTELELQGRHCKECTTNANVALQRHAPDATGKRTTPVQMSTGINSKQRRAIVQGWAHLSTQQGHCHEASRQAHSATP